MPRRTCEEGWSHSRRLERRAGASRTVLDREEARGVVAAVRLNYEEVRELAGVDTHRVELEAKDVVVGGAINHCGSNTTAADVADVGQEAIEREHCDPLYYAKACVCEGVDEIGAARAIAWQLHGFGVREYRSEPCRSGDRLNRLGSRWAAAAPASQPTLHLRYSGSFSLPGIID